LWQQLLEELFHCPSQKLAHAKQPATTTSFTVVFGRMTVICHHAQPTGKEKLPRIRLHATNTGAAPLALLKKQVKTLFQLICCERKILFQLKKQAEKYEL